MAKRTEQANGHMAPLVLIVEDEGPIVEALVAIVEDAGFRAVSASDGRAGLDLARTQRPDLIITDFMMPHMDGLAMIRALRADAAREATPVPPIILTSAAAHATLAQSGADALMPKPFDIRHVERLLRRFLLGHADGAKP